MSIKISGSDGIEMASDDSLKFGDLGATKENLWGRKNILINGDFRVNQRGFNGNWASVSNNSYGYDRWKRTDPGLMTQVVEDVNYKPNTTYTLSGVNVTTTQMVSPSSGHWTISVPNDASYIQLEEGDQATSFEHRSYGEELALCQRYYYRNDSDSTVGMYLFGYGNTPSTYAVNNLAYPVTMRADPTITILSSTASGASYSVQNSSTNRHFVSIAANVVNASAPACTISADAEL